MDRIQFIEIQDQSWCPKAIRDALTETLQFTLSLGNQYAPVVHRLRTALERTGTKEIVDLCSGAGGPWLRLLRAFEKNENYSVTVCLTDKFPNTEAFRAAEEASSGKIHSRESGVEATAVPSDLAGFRTLFSSFHHFPPEQAQAILRDAVTNRQGIAVFEMTQRSFLALALFGLSPAMMFATAPFVRPFRWSRLFLTYMIPILPLAGLFDGLVSCLRTYSPAELETFVEKFRKEDYVWQIGEDRSGAYPVPITYLIGFPDARSTVWPAA